MINAKLAGQTAIVTGAGSGIGAAIATRLAADGARVVVNYRASRVEAEKVVEAVTVAGGKAMAAQADVTDSGQIDRLFGEAEAAFGIASILVNNAALADRTPFAELDVDRFDQVFATNARGPFLCVLAFARRLRTDGGRIVNIASGQARSPQPGTVLYSSSKGAVEAMTRAFAADLGPRGITVNAVAPGATASENFKRTVPEELQSQTIGNTALGRLGTPSDVADVVAFLASQDARWITGQVIDADGGLRR